MKTILSFALLISLTACSSHKTAKENVEKKAAEETTVTGQTLGTTINDLIQNSKTLTDAQKKELEGIIAQNKQRAEELSAQSFKFRAVLIKELLSGKAVNKREVRILKKNIQKVEADRLSNTFETVERISKIVSNEPENDKFRDSLINMEARSMSIR